MAMAVLIGVVKGVIGQVLVIHSDGSRRAVVDGERLFAGDTLDTGTAGAVAVHLTNGNDLTLGRGSSLQLTSQLLSDQPPSIVVHDQAIPDGSQLTEVQQIQQAIAAGADPTQALEATAAGPGSAVYTNTPAGDLGGGHSFVLLTETAGSVSPIVGFPTNGLGFALLETQQPVGDLFQTTDADTTTPVVPPDVPPVVVPPVVVPPDTPPVTPPDNGITFVDLYRDGGEQRVFEADLPNGTNTAQGKGGDLSRTDVFSVVAPDGLASLTIDGVQVVSNGQLVPNTDNGSVQIVGQLGNTLTITGYDPATGVFNYTYVLSVDQQNNQTTSNTELSEDFHLVASDTDGDAGDAWLNVRITDDSPIANNDVGSTVTQQSPEITGSVLANDFVGADSNANPVSIDPALNPGFSVSGQTIIGTYGTLTLGTDGTYTYVLNPESEAFQAYKDSGLAAKETFTYTLTDGDGDATTATLTVNVAANHEVIFNWLHASGGDLIFAEADLPSGTSVEPNKASFLTDHSSVYIDAKDGLANLNIEVQIGGQTVSTQVVVNNALVGGGPVQIVGESGNILTITNYDATTGILSYSYTLSQPGHNNSPVTGDLANLQLSDDFHMVATDSDGDTGSAWINITIKDDAPTAGNDIGASLVTDKAPELTGSVLSNDKVGADTNAAPVSIKASDNPDFSVNGQTVEGKYGTLTLNADGTYDYVLNTSSDAFKALKASGLEDQEVFKYTLTDGDGDSTTANLTIDIGANHSVIFNWLGSTGGDLEFKEADLPGGTNTAADKGNFLTDHSSVYIDAKDGLATLSIDTIVNGQTVTTQVIANGVLVNAQGVVVPGESGNNLTITDYNPSTGVLSYSYTLAQPGHNDAPGTGDPLANTQLSDDFKLVATDSDGDTASAWINITIKDDAPVANNDQGDSTLSSKLSSITGDVLSNDHVGADTNANPVSITDSNGKVVTTLEGQFGTLELGTDGKYTYTLDPNSPAYQALANGQTASETFTYTLTDGDGDSTTANLVIDVKSDLVVNGVPVAAAQEATVTSGATGANVLLVIDVSNSMNDIVKGTTLSRLDLAKQAVDKMLLQYADIGDVKVQVTTFNNQTHQVSGEWVDVAKAISLVNSLTAGGGTNYDYALDGAKAAYAADGKLEGAGVQTVSYFVSDGNPTLSSDAPKVTSEQSGNRTDTGLGDGIDSSEAAVWTEFLKLHDIKSFAIGIGNSVQAQYLNPIAYDGATGQDVPPQLVRDVTQLPNILGGTVQGQPVTGALTDGGGFGTDGGFVKSISVDGVKYSFDGSSTLTAGAGAVADNYRYFASSHELAVSTQEGGLLQVNLLTGAYTYTPPVGAAQSFTETVLFTLTDTDGDQASNALTVHVLTDTPVTAAAETVITNVLDSSITLPADALLANASAGTHLTSSTTFDTGWGAPRGADFSSTPTATVNFRGQAQSRLDLDRSQFGVANASTMSAAVVVLGALGAVGTVLASDTLTVELKKGESVHLDSTLSGSHASLAWAAGDGAYTVLGEDGNFTATEDGIYKVHVTNLAGTEGNKGESYQLTLTVDYSHATTTPVHTDTYSVVDGHGDAATGALAIHYQAGTHLVGTDGNDVLVASNDHSLLEGGKGDDVLVAGSQGDDLYGNDGNDLLISGAGDDILDGGAGNNTASYQGATSGVRVDLTQVGVEQDTQGGGHDTLTGIQNLIGSAHDDVLIGDIHDNVLIGGKGNDTLTGGGGNDTFKWQDGDTGHDTVTDFKLGSDTLDLSQLLHGENSVASSLENFLQFKVTGTGDGLVSTIEISSLGNDKTTQTISLEHVDVASNYGVQVGAGGMVANGHDTATIISGMLSDHSLKADTV
jgi:VCBS repeat-containing protein